MRRTSPWSILGCVGVLACAATAGAQPSGAAPGEFSDQVIELPPVTVTESRDLPPPEEWRYAEIEGFEVLSNASQQATNRLLKDFQKFRQALHLIRPSPVQPLASTSIIFCGNRGKFTDFTTDGKRDYNGIVSLFLRDREQASIVVDLEVQTINPHDISMWKPNGDQYEEMRIDHDRQLYREYARFLLTQSEIVPPPWLLEGLTQIVMDMEFSAQDIKLGRLDITQGMPVMVGPPPEPRTMDASNMLIALSSPASREAPDFNTVVGDRQFNIVLARHALLPLDKFFAVKADAPEALNPLGDCLWAKQAYAFVHMCLFRAEGKLQKSYATFVNRLANEPVSEALFQECFQMSYKQMVKELDAYIRYPRHVFRHIRLTKEGRLTADVVVFREATQGEIGRIKGDAQRLASRRSDALATYRTAYARGERDPRLLGAFGVEEQHAGQTNRARKFLEAAAKLGTDRPSAYVALARLRLDEAKAKPAAEGGRLSPQQVAAVFAPLLKARALKPALAETYEVMAETWALSAVQPTVENVHVLGEGVMQFPFNSDLTYRTAQLYAQAGDPWNAAELARLGIRFASDAATSSRFEAFLATLPPPAPAAVSR